MVFPVAVGALPLSADDTTATWIGGPSGAALTAANWGLEKIEDCKGYFRITNTVTFTESGASYFWNIASLTVENRSTVTFAARYWHNTGSKTEILDIGEGSEVKPTYMMGGEKTKSFYRRGAGTLTTTSVGSNGNVWKNVYFEDGLSKANAFYVTDLIDIAAPATVRLTAATGATQGNPVWNVNGLLDCNNQKIPSIAGVSGSGVITNANNLTVNLLKPNLTFDGAIQGRLVIEPSADAEPDTYMVIGNAQTLANAELVVRDVEGHGDPIRFAAGIGTFYARRFDRNRTYLDTEGNPVTLVESRMHLYVDSSRQGGAGDGLSWQTAYQTLKEAMESPSLDPLGTIVHVAEGTYSNGVMESGSTVFRVIVPDNVELRSEAGAEKTFIVGAESPTPTSYGCGPGAIRCLKMAQSSRIEGFTITGGRVTNYASGNNGGGCKGNGTMVDCVISNNVAYQGAAVECGNESTPTTFIRCRFLQNRSGGLGSALFYSSVLYDCLFDGNLGSDTIYTGAGKVYAYNCTFGPNNANNAIRTYGQNGNLAHAYNCVFMKPVVGSSATQTNILLHTCLATQPPTNGALADDDCTVTNVTSTVEALAFAGLDADLRPLVSGRGRTVDAGTNSTHKLPDLESGDWDVYHAKRIQGARIDLGAVELDPTRTFVDLSVPEGGVTVEGIGLGRTEIAKDASVTITLRRTFTSERLCTGIFVNGEFLNFDDYPDGWTKTVVGTGVSSYLNVEAVYSSENVIYVDCGPKGDDGNKGYHPDCPRKTLLGAMTPTPPSGTVVRAAPGEYAEGTFGAETDLTLNRVVVPAGVRLESTGGAAVTFIRGAKAPEEKRCRKTASFLACGFGTNSVRAVKLEANAVLRGFTVTDGTTWGIDANSYHTAGNIKAEMSAYIVDCVITNGAAPRGGGAEGGNYIRCRFTGNTAPSLGSALYGDLNLYGCVIEKGTSGSYCWYINRADGAKLKVVNTVFAADNEGASIRDNSDGKNCHLYNTVDLRGANQGIHYHAGCITVGKVSTSTVDEGVVITNAAAVGIGAGGVPTRDSLATDTGVYEDFVSKWPAAYADEATRDILGTERILNGTIDLGAVEYDWKKDFAAELSGKPNFAVTAATTNVVLGADGGVVLSDGERMSAAWGARGKTADVDYGFTVTVTGTGTLTYAVDGGEPVAVPAGTQTITLKGTNAAKTFDFAFAGDGSATFTSFTRRANVGVLLLVR